LNEASAAGTGNKTATRRHQREPLRQHRADPGPLGVLLVRRLAVLPFGDTHAHGTEGAHFFPRAARPRGEALPVAH